MSDLDRYQAPFDTDTEPQDPDLVAAHQAWIEGEFADPDTETPPQSQEFIGRWNLLVSRTNWEKGRIISQWRQTLIESGASASTYSDDAWSKQVGGVTAPHVGRLRRVFDHFADTCESYPNLSWTHFLIALDWDDAPLWLQGASDGRWSVSAMRNQRWEAGGGLADEQPSDTDLEATDIDEDFVSLDSKDGLSPALVQPAQGGSGSKYNEEPSEISSGPIAEAPDFGDEESLARMPSSKAGEDDSDDQLTEGKLVQPFAGLPALPDDLAEAVELLKLGIVRHKATGWQAVELDTVRAYMSAFLVLIDARSR